MLVIFVPILIMLNACNAFFIWDQHRSQVYPTTNTNLSYWIFDKTREIFVPVLTILYSSIWSFKPRWIVLVITVPTLIMLNPLGTFLFKIKCPCMGPNCTKLPTPTSPYWNFCQTREISVPVMPIIYSSIWSFKPFVDRFSHYRSNRFSHYRSNSDNV
jgi:hypothetical protein